MAQAALGRTVLAAGGTLVVLGGATVVVSTVSMGVTKMIVDRSKVRMVFSSCTSALMCIEICMLP